MLNKKEFRFSSFILLMCLLFLNACQQNLKSKLEEAYLSNEILNATVSVNFSPNGRLWRLTPTKNAMYTNYSDDNGKTFSDPVRVNKQDQKISAWPENPPAIEISELGRINVLYYADEQQKSTSFFSYSDDDGKTFSTPVLISNHAESARHYMDQMRLGKNRKLYFFWHDTRENTSDSDAGNLSIYYSINNSASGSTISNQLLSKEICSCCRTAIALSNEDKPVILARMIYGDGARDHALIQMTSENNWKKTRRVTYDNWKIEGCPEHGPALAIDSNNRIHFTWFTQGNTRNGIFYAQTDDNGISVSPPIALGNPDHLPSHADVIAVDQKVVIVWKEFDGEKTTVHIKKSSDRGKTWVQIATNISARSNSSHPKLITNHTDIFLSWTTRIKGHRIIKL